MRKRLLAGIVSLCIVFSMFPVSVFAEGEEAGETQAVEAIGTEIPAIEPIPAAESTAIGSGTIEEITKYGTVDGSKITVAGSTLEWYAADTSVGRYQDGWWIGAKIIAPAAVNTQAKADKVKYSNDGTDNLAKNFGTNKDGEWWMGCWVPVTPEYLETALTNGKVLTWTYKFDWDGNGTVDQTYNIVVDPSNITLNKDGAVWCKTVDGKFTVKEGFEVPGTGAIEEITKYGTVDGSKITVAGSTLEWYAKDSSIGRWQDGWWIGAKIIAPAAVNTAEKANKVKYSNNGSDNLEKNFGTNRDGEWWMGCWVPVTPEYLETAIANGSNLTWTYKFDWDGNGTVDQTFNIVVDPSNITLNKDGAVWCKTVDGKFTVATENELRLALEIGAKDIVLTDNITVNTALKIKDTNINLNNKALNLKVGNNTIDGTVAISGGNICVTGVNATANAIMEIGASVADSVFTLNNVNITGDGYASAYSILYVRNGGTLNIYGGSIDVKNEQHSAGGVIKSEIADNAKINIKDAYLRFINAGRGILNGTVVLDNVNMYVDGGENAINQSILTVKNSTITVRNNKGRALTPYLGNINVINSTLDFDGSQEGDIRFKADKEITFDETSKLLVSNVWTDVAGAKINGVAITGTKTSPNKIKVENGKVYYVDDNAVAQITTGNVVKQYATLEAAVEDAAEGATIVLLSDVKLTKMLDIKKSVTIDGYDGVTNHVITAAGSFGYTYDNDRHLIQVNDANAEVVLSNVTIKTTTANKHALNVYNSEKVTLYNVTLDHSTALKGAPLVINSSEVVVNGNFTVKAGNASWYGINLDNKSDKRPKLSISEIAEVNFVATNKVFIDTECVGSNVVELGNRPSCMFTYDNAGKTHEVYNLDHVKTAVDEVAATCVDEGIKAHYKCTACGKLFENETSTTAVDISVLKIQPTGVHTYGDWTVVKAPTCVSKGSEKRECSVCHAVKTQDIRATGVHTYGDWHRITDPTCVAEGQDSSSCSVCGDTRYAGVAMTAHTYGTDGKCIVCGTFDATKVTATPTPVPTPTPTPTATPEPETTPAPTPTPAPTEADTTITEVVATEEVIEAVKDTVTVEEGVAKVETETVEKVVEATEEGKEIVLPLKEVTENVVNKVEISSEALDAVAEKEADVVIQLTDATVKLDKEAVAAIKEQAGDRNIEIRAVQTETSALTETQQSALENKETAIVVTAQVFADGEYVGDFKGGKATIMLPFTPDEGKAAEDYKVYFVKEDGSLEAVAAQYVDGYMVFTTGHFSEYAIVYEKVALPGGDTVTTPENTGKTMPIIPIVIAVAVCVIACAVIAMRKKREE